MREKGRERRREKKEKERVREREKRREEGERESPKGHQSSVKSQQNLSLSVNPDLRLGAFEPLVAEGSRTTSREGQTEQRVPPMPSLGSCQRRPI